MSYLLDSHSPKLVLSFGAFAFEFAKRSRDEAPHRAYRHWSTKRLGDEFRRRIEEFNPHEVNLVPLLQVSIAGRHLLRSHSLFTQTEDGNYFDYVGRRIADCLGTNCAEFPIG